MNGSRWRGETLHCEFDWSEVPPSVALMEAIARYEDEVDGVSGGVAELLYYYFDPAALDALVESQTPATITLQLEDYHVGINETAIRISLREPAVQWPS